jgi:hypothetical protein
VTIQSNDPNHNPLTVALTGYAPAYQANAVVDATSGAIDSQLALEYTNLLQQTFQKKRRSAQDAYALYSTATAGVLPGNVVFPNTSVGRDADRIISSIQQHEEGRKIRRALTDRFKAMFADLSDTIDTVEGNPLPESYEVRLQPSARIASQYGRSSAAPVARKASTPRAIDAMPSGVPCAAWAQPERMVTAARRCANPCSPASCIAASACRRVCSGSDRNWCKRAR